MFGRKAAVIAATGVFGSALLGGAALAAFAPADLADYQTSLIAGVLPGDATSTSQAPAAGAADKVKAMLDALVAKNVITQAQEAAILAGLKDLKGDRAHEDLLRRVLAGLFEQSATYLGTKPTALRATLPGTSLGTIADKTAGKTKTGLVASLNASVNGAIDKAQADGKITKDQADKARAAAPDQVAKFVDHTYPTLQKTVTPKTPRAVAPKVQAFIGDAVTAAREYLGPSTADLAASLRSGKSLGEVANGTSGKTREGLVAAITTSTNAKIDKAQQDGKLTAEQATQLKTVVGTAVAQLVDRKGQVKASTRS
ncbi:MAG: hypothetical protein M3R54_01635 [Chloroflexota bacterium]|nr:hypothetical protein [Chloroflexota bacterium]